MRSFLRVFIPIVLMSILIAGCSQVRISEYVRVNKMLSGLDTYFCTAEIAVQGNKVVENYVVKQYFMYPDKYRLEVLSPEDKKGKLTIYDGSSLYISHPQIKQEFTLGDIKGLEDSGMFPGCFARNLLISESADYSIKKIGNQKYVVIRAEIPDGNAYRKSQILYFDAESSMPCRMEILDSNDNVAVMVTYKDFNYNIKLDEFIFRKQ